jgi:hypothetical protein
MQEQLTDDGMYRELPSQYQYGEFKTMTDISLAW